MRRRGQRQLLVDDAWLDERGLGGRIDLEDPAHASHLQSDAAANRDGAARQSGARAARHDRDAVARRDLHHIADLLRVRGQHDGVGHRPLDRRVALEDAQVVGARDDVIPADHASQLFDDLWG